MDRQVKRIASIVLGTMLVVTGTSVIGVAAAQTSHSMDLHPDDEPTDRVLWPSDPPYPPSSPFSPSPTEPTIEPDCTLPVEPTQSLLADRLEVDHQPDPGPSTDCIPQLIT